MRIRVLGSAAGGGFPQWNCGCRNCRGLREGTVAAVARTQESVAVTTDGEGWVLVNASPEIRGQVEACTPLHPRAPRHSPIQAILLTNGDLDHCLGLLSLRESQPLVVYSTERVRRGFTDGNVLYRTLQRFSDQITWRSLPLGRSEHIVDVAGSPTGLSVEAVAVPGKLPLHLEGLAMPDAEDNVGFKIRETATGRLLAYFSGVGAITPSVVEALQGTDCVFFDGTFWSSDELSVLGLGTKRAEQMAHAPVGGKHGSLALLADLHAPRRILIHVNNSNPLLRDDSAERAQAEARGWEIAFDGMEVLL
jgi:pyrroloquinoline quinone biosynthesis protein B